MQRDVSPGRDGLEHLRDVRVRQAAHAAVAHAHHHVAGTKSAWKHKQRVFINYTYCLLVLIRII